MITRSTYYLEKYHKYSVVMRNIIFWPTWWPRNVEGNLHAIKDWDENDKKVPKKHNSFMHHHKQVSRLSISSD